MQILSLMLLALANPAPKTMYCELAEMRNTPTGYQHITLVSDRVEVTTEGARISIWDHKRPTTLTALYQPNYLGKGRIVMLFGAREKATELAAYFTDPEFMMDGSLTHFNEHNEDNSIRALCKFSK